MRQAQQNRRGRGRNNNNRKSQNPLTRSYESNGPDVKIRGTPSHIAEKYVTMARDALSSGDPVLAENYLQHAEHYNRIIMTHREQQSSHGHDAAHGGQMSGQVGRQRGSADMADDEQPIIEESGEEAAADAKAPRGSEPQPDIAAAERAPEERRPQRRTARRERNPDRERATEREPRAADAERADGDPPGAGRANGRGRRTRYAQTDDQPEFLKRPVRRPRASSDAEAEETAPAAVAENSDQAAE